MAYMSVTAIKSDMPSAPAGLHVGNSNRERYATAPAGLPVGNQKKQHLPSAPEGLHVEMPVESYKGIVSRNAGNGLFTSSYVYNCIERSL